MKALTIETPGSVTMLGYGGLIPFVLLTLGLWAEPAHADFWTLALVSYGAVILSFVGAIHWGAAMLSHELSARRTNRRLVWSVVPSLMGWVATLMSAQMGIGLLILGFVLHYWQDLRLHTQMSLPPWYLPLRRRLSGVACASLALATWVI